MKTLLDINEIKVLRNLAKLTQGQLADQCQLSRISMNRIEKGRTSPKRDTLERITDTLLRVSARPTLEYYKYLDATSGKPISVVVKSKFEFVGGNGHVYMIRFTDNGYILTTIGLKAQDRSGPKPVY